MVNNFDAITCFIKLIFHSLCYFRFEALLQLFPGEFSVSTRHTQIPFFVLVSLDLQIHDVLGIWFQNTQNRRIYNLLDFICTQRWLKKWVWVRRGNQHRSTLHYTSTNATTMDNRNVVVCDNGTGVYYFSLFSFLICVLKPFPNPAIILFNFFFFLDPLNNSTWDN